MYCRKPWQSDDFTALQIDIDVIKILAAQKACNQAENGGMNYFSETGLWEAESAVAGN